MLLDLLNQIIEIKADKFPLGTTSKNYTSDVIKFTKDDCLYLFTDGFLDQFGGPKGKKYKYKPFKKLLLSTTSSAMKDQMKKLDDSFEEWKGDLEQVDDVCLFGVQL